MTISLLGGANIVLGFVSIIFYSVIVGIKIPMYHTGCGLWSGSLLILAGAMGIYAGRAGHRMSCSFSLLASIIALLAKVAALALSIYVYYFLTQIYPDHRENMPIYQVYLAFHSLWFLAVVAGLIFAILQVKQSKKLLDEASRRSPQEKSNEVFIDTQGRYQPEPSAPGRATYY